VSARRRVNREGRPTLALPYQKGYDTMTTRSETTGAGGTASRRVTFQLGHLLATPGVLDLLERHGVSAAMLLACHAAGDWGAIDPEDRGLNEQALRTGARIFSVYPVGQETVWVITNAADDEDIRDATTLLLPSEY